MHQGTAVEIIASKTRDYKNSIVYSNYSLARLKEAIYRLSETTESYTNRKATADGLNLTPADLAELDQIANCPMVALVRVADLVCRAYGMERESCLPTEYYYRLTPILDSVRSRNACEYESSAPVKDLLWSQTPVDF